MSSPAEKKISLFHLVETAIERSRPAPRRGVSRSSRARSRMRWTQPTRKDEARLMRTAKSCGSGAPMLASSLRNDLHRRRWQESPVTGKSTKETVKTIACGNAGLLGTTVVYLLVCFFHPACEAAGAHGAPGIPHALVFRGRRTVHDSGLSKRRENTLRCQDAGVRMLALHRLNHVQCLLQNGSRKQRRKPHELASLQ